MSNEKNITHREPALSTGHTNHHEPCLGGGLRVLHLLTAIHGADPQLASHASALLKSLGRSGLESGMALALDEDQPRTRFDTASRLLGTQLDRLIASEVHELEDLIPALDNLRYAAQMMAIIGITQVGVSALPQMLEALQHPEADIRQIAAAALGRIADPSALPALQAALGDESTVVRDVAAGAIAAIEARQSQDARLLSA